MIELPDPPTVLTFENVWIYLEKGLDKITAFEGIDVIDYSKLYSTVHSYCAKSDNDKGTSDPPISASSQRPGPAPPLVGGELYDGLSKYLKKYLEGVKQKSEEYTDQVQLLQYYTEAWTKYTGAARLINNIFQYVNRYWIKREIEEDRKSDIYFIFTLALVSWKKYMFDGVQHKIVAALLALVTKERNGESIETSLLRNVIDSFVSLGIDHNDPTNTKTNMDVYRDYFEKEFLNTTKIYYKTESERFITENTIPEYMRKAEARLNEEEYRIQMYLHSTTHKTLIPICEEVLVKEHSESICGGFQTLLRSDSQDDLQRMYSLLARVPNGLDPLRLEFENHIKKAGVDAINIIDASEALFVDPETYIGALLKVHKKYNDLVQTAFNDETGFVAALDKACGEFVNRNKFCKSSNKSTESSKSPELLVKYCDSLLKKTSKKNVDELEDALNNAMIVFKYVEDKDVFQKFYSKMLAKRLVNKSSSSDDNEKSMISRLKEASGSEYSFNLQRMVTDIQLSKESLDEWSIKYNSPDHPDNSAKSSCFDVLVLGSSFWPFQPPAAGFKLPEFSEKFCKDFEDFYKKKHEGRKLNWLFQLCKAELTTNYLKKKFIFLVSAYQMGVLLQFNETDSCTKDELLSRTGLVADALDPALAVLVKASVLLSKDSDVYNLNRDFKSSKLRINLNVQMKSEQKRESTETHKTIEEDRSFVIQAAIVRIMKTRKTMKHVSLIEEVINQLNSRFKLHIPVIKKAVDMLLEKEYIARTEGEKDMYEYVA